MIQPFELNERKLFDGVLDFSFLLDAPAGKHGFVKVKDGHFYSNNERIRFYGFDIAFEGLFMPKEKAELVANRLSKAGVNFVRLHAEDTLSWDKKRDMLINYSNGDSRTFTEQGLDQLDYLFYCLKSKGIYMQADLFVARRFMPGDELDYEDALGVVKQVNVFNRRLIELQKEFATKYLLHVNPYTGLRLIDDPAVAVIEIMNEDSIYWLNDLEQRGGPSYQMELDRRFNHYLLAKYGSRKALDTAWTSQDGIHALLDEEDPEVGTVRRIAHIGGTQMYIDWKADYAGITSPARYADYTEFLTGIQLNFSQEMRDHVLSLGAKCAINISNHAQGAADIYSLDRYADVNQNNAYWNHPTPRLPEGPSFHNMNMVEKDPRDTMVDSPFKLNLVTRLNHDRVAGKPFMTTEWNILYGTDFRSDALPMMAAYGSLQDWDGMVLYSYMDRQEIDPTKLYMPFNLLNDPAVWGQVGLCSYIFQKNLISPGRNRLEVCYSERDLYAVPRNWIAPYGCASYVSQVAAKFIGLKYEGDADAALASGNTPNGDYTKAQHALIFSRSPYADGMQKYRSLESFLDLHRGEGSNFEVVEDGDSIDADYRNYSRILDTAMKKWGLLSKEEGLIDDRKLVSDTKELTFDFTDGVFYTDSPLVKIVSGNTKGVNALGHYQFHVKNDKMTLMLLPLDNREVNQSNHLLLCALGWCGNLDVRYAPGENGRRIMVEEGHGPVSIDTLEGTIAASAPIKIYPLNPEGKRLSELPVSDGVITFNGNGTMYFEIVNE